jgi:hypothetical protein
MFHRTGEISDCGAVIEIENCNGRRPFTKSGNEKSVDDISFESHETGRYARI